MAEVGDLVRYRVAERHRTKTRKVGPAGANDRIEIPGSVFHHAHEVFAGVIAAEAEASPSADPKTKPPREFVIGLFVPDKPIAYVRASEGGSAGQFKVLG